MRTVTYRFRGRADLRNTLESASHARTLPLPPGCEIGNHDWVVAMFELDESLAATGAAATCTEQGLLFERRDWQRLLGFVSTPYAAPKLAFTAPAARVLVVEDDALAARLVSHTLEAARLSVETLGTAEDALRSVRLRAPDLLVLDWSLPVMSGLDFLRVIRAEPHLEHLPAIFLTAHRDTDRVVEAFAHGADDYVVKPFHPAELTARVVGLIRRRSQPPLTAG